MGEGRGRGGAGGCEAVLGSTVGGLESQIYQGKEVTRMGIEVIKVEEGALD